jgi:hypothetical protein
MCATGSECPQAFVSADDSSLSQEVANGNQSPISLRSEHPVYFNSVCVSTDFKLSTQTQRYYFNIEPTKRQIMTLLSQTRINYTRICFYVCR